MFKVEPDQRLRHLMKLFYQFGVWRDEEDESDSRKLCRRMLWLIQHITFLSFVLVCAYLSDDRNQQFFLASCSIAIVVLTIKLAYLLWRKDEILKFLYDPIVTHNFIKNFGEWVKVNGKIKRILKFSEVYLWSIIVSSVLLILVPLPIFTSEKVLPLFIRFEMECDYDFVLYWLAYGYLSTGIVFDVVYNFLMIYIWYIMFNYSIENKLLGNQFRSLGWPTEEKQAGKETKSKPRNSFHQDLIGLIHAHQNLFETVERFRSCFSTLFLTEIITGGISICFSTYNLAYITPESFVQMTFFVVLLLYAIFDIFLIMYLANEITVESDRMSYCLFECNWMDQSEKTKKCIIIMCEMIKQPQQLVVFIYPMNLEKFTSIVNGAYSMFNILKSFNQ